jgi:hypothetical protein
MKLFRLRSVGITGLLALMLLTVGCTSSQSIRFEGPQGAVMLVNEKPYHLPALIQLERPAGVGESKRYDVSLVFTSQDSKEVRTNGFLDLFGYNESDADRVVVTTCNLDETQLVKILNGTVIIFKGQSASRQPIYELTLGKK